jgi:hypothetical protein
MGQFYKLFRCSNAKSVFLVVNASLRWLNNVSGAYFVQVSLLLIGQQVLGHFFRYQPLLSIGWVIVQILRHAGGKRLIQRQILSAILAASQSTFTNKQFKLHM